MNGQGGGTGRDVRRSGSRLTPPHRRFWLDTHGGLGTHNDGWGGPIVTEIIENDAGDPCWFVAERDELQQAIDTIPADVLREANDRQWLNRGLAPPRRSIREQRRRLLAKHEEAARLMADERVLPIEEAARHLDLTGRVLRYRIQQGEFEDVVRELPGGRVGLAFKPPAKRWSLVVERPDPRVLAWLGQTGRLRSIEPGSEFAPGYDRCRDGANWRTSW